MNFGMAKVLYVFAALIEGFFIEVLPKCHHALLRQRLMPFLAKCAPCSQSASALSLRCLLQFLATQKHSVACVFLDVEAAADSVCRDFLVLRHHGPEVTCSRIGLDEVQTDALLRKLLEAGGALELAGVGRHLQALAAL